MERPVERGGFNRLDGGSDPDEVEVEVAEEAEVKEAEVKEAEVEEWMF